MAIRKALAAVFAVALVALAVGATHAQQMPEMQHEAPMVMMEEETMIVTDFDRLFEPKTATIEITTAGIVISPDPPAPGPITFTVHNRTGLARGVVMTGIDRADTPIIRYTRMISPQGTTTVEFWIYPERDFTVRDYTHRRIVAGRSIWTSTFVTAFAAPSAPTMVVAIGPPIGAGPLVPEPEVTPMPTEPQHVQLSIVNRTLTMEPAQVQPGTVHFRITNSTTVERAFGIEIDGQVHQTRLLAPGETEEMRVEVPTAGTYQVFTVVRGQRTLMENLIVR